MKTITVTVLADSRPYLPADVLLGDGTYTHTYTGELSGWAEWLQDLSELYSVDGAEIGIIELDGVTAEELMAQ